MAISELFLQFFRLCFFIIFLIGVNTVWRERDDLIAPPCCISKSQFGLKLIQDKTFWKKEKSPRTILDPTEDQQSNPVYPSAPQWTQIKAKHLHCFITDDIFHPIKWNLKKLKTTLGVDRVKPWSSVRISLGLG